MKEFLDKGIDDYLNQTGKPPTEIRMTIQQYKELLHELKGIKPSKDMDSLLIPLTHRGININWGVWL